MTPPASSLTEYAAPLAIGAVSLVASVVVIDVPVAHALIVSASLVGGMAAGTAARLYVQRLRPPRTDG